MAYMPRETYQTVRKLSRLFGNFPDCPETLQTVRKIFTLSEKFINYLERFQNVRKLSRLFGNFPDCLESFQTVQKLSILSINFPDCPETFQTVRKITRLSGNFKNPEIMPQVSEAVDIDSTPPWWLACNPKRFPYWSAASISNHTLMLKRTKF